MHEELQTKSFIFSLTKATRNTIKETKVFRYIKKSFFFAFHDVRHKRRNKTKIGNLPSASVLFGSKCMNCI